MGKWLAGSEWLQSKWHHHYCYTSRRLFWWDDETNSYSQHARLLNSKARNSKFDAIPEQLEVTLPATAIPVDAEANAIFLIFPSVARIQPGRLPAPSIAPTHDYFEHYIAALPEWDRLLVTDTKWEDMDEDWLCELIEEEVELILASDGGAAHHNGSYGALIASHPEPHEQDGQVLIEVGGRAFGDDPGSFRAESYGLLAILRLLFHVSVHYTLKPACSLRFLCDNQGLLTRIEKGVRRPYVTPRHFLISDIDVEMQILDTIKLLNRPTSFEHIHSHQDDGPRNAPLSWNVQLNSICDASATAQLHKLTDPTTETPLAAAKLVPFLPASQVSLEIQGQTINRKIPSTIRHICGATLPFNDKTNQIEYLCNRHGWTRTEFDSIDWNRFSSAIHSRGFYPEMFLFKWTNHIAPLLLRQKKFGLSPTAECPSPHCGCPEEDESHLLRCEHPARLAILKNLRDTLKDSFNRHHVDPWLRQILFAYLASFDGVDDFNLDALTAPYLRLAQAQADLGANSLFFGYFHVDWHTLQHAYLKQQNKPSDRNQASTLVKSWLNKFHKVAQDIWRIRCHHLHGKQGIAEYSFTRVCLLLDVSDQYAFYDQILPSDRVIFQKLSLEDRQEHSIPQLKLWLKYVKPLIKRSLNTAAIAGPLPQITDYFHTVRPPEDA